MVGVTVRLMSKWAKIPRQLKNGGLNFEIFSAENRLVPAKCHARIRTDIKILLGDDFDALIVNCHDEKIKRPGLNVFSSFISGGGHAIKDTKESEISIHVLNSTDLSYSVALGDKIAFIIVFPSQRGKFQIELFSSTSSSSSSSSSSFTTKTKSKRTDSQKEGQLEDASSASSFEHSSTSPNLMQPPIPPDWSPEMKEYASRFLADKKLSGSKSSNDHEAIKSEAQAQEQAKEQAQAQAQKQAQAQAQAQDTQVQQQTTSSEKGQDLKTITRQIQMILTKSRDKDADVEEEEGGRPIVSKPVSQSHPRYEFQKVDEKEMLKSCWMIEEGIWIGDYLSLLSPDWMQIQKVTHILTLMSEWNPMLDSNHLQGIVARKIVLMHENSTRSFRAHLRECLSFIGDAICHPGTILVHSRKGHTRAQAIIAAFLIVHRQKTVSQAINFLVKICPMTNLTIYQNELELLASIGIKAYLQTPTS
jgi:dUTPase